MSSIRCGRVKVSTTMFNFYLILGIENRNEMDSKITKDFVAYVKENNLKLVVHWDGKIVKNSTNTGQEEYFVDRLPIIVTGGGVSKVLDIPKLKSGTGVAMANAIYEALVTWDLVDYVVGFCFDTTRSNTGVYTGAAAVLNSKFMTNKLFFECRHHVAELFLGAAFEAIFGKTGKTTCSFSPYFHSLKLSFTFMCPRLIVRLLDEFKKHGFPVTLNFLKIYIKKQFIFYTQTYITL